MSLSLGELLYLHCYQDVELDSSIFRDKDTKEFILALQKMPIESVRGLDRWGEVSPTPISKEAGMDAINNDIFTPLVNERMEFLRHKLLTHDWSALAEAFPEIENKHFKSYNIKNPMDLVLEDIDYFPFFPEWDGENGNAMRGLRDDDLIVLFALSKMGKSTICAYLAYKAINEGIPIGFYPTELTIPVTLKYILGYEYGLRGNESLMYFSQNPERFKELIEKYNHLIYLPPTNIFNWGDYTSLYESPAKIIFQDNFVRSLAHLGLNEDATNANQLSRKFSTLQQKYQKATFIVTQEAVRAASTKELEANPDVKEIGTGHVALGRGLQQECFDDKTEVLTERGYILIKDLLSSDKVAQYTEGKLEFVSPTAYINKEYAGTMYHLEGKFIDICTTENHRWLIRNAKTLVEEVRLAREVPFKGNHHILNTTELNKAEGLDIEDNLLRLVIATQADGCYVKGTKKVYFHLSRPEKINRLTNLLDSLSIDYKIYSCQSKSTIVESTDLYNRVISYLPNKVITTELVLSLSSNQLGICAEEIPLWDGSLRYNGSITYVSTVRENIDSVQLIYTLVGQKSVIRVVTPEGNRQITYYLNINPRGYTHIQSNKLTKKADYKGTVYCVSVPSGLLLVRRNGLTCISGNCSLLLNITNRANNSIGKKIIISNDRFRGVSDIDSQISLEITKRGTLHIEVLHDHMTSQIRKAERMLAETERSLS